MPVRATQPSTSQRSEHTASYLTQEELARAGRLLAIQKSRAEGADISGEQMEQCFAEIIGGTWLPARSNRPTPDLWDADGVGYSLKTLQLRPVASKPHWEQRIGEEVKVPITRIKPKGKLPAGKTFLDAGAQSVGNRIVAAFNESLESYGVERQVFILRLRVEHEQLTRYLCWIEDITALEPKTLKWADSGHGDTEDGWSRNLRATYRDHDPKGPADLSWNSSGSQLWVRHEIPEDVDTWVVPDSQVLDRREGNQALARAIDAKLGI